MTTLAHISFVPKEHRAQLRKMGKTLFVCRACNMQIARGEPRPLRNPEGYVHEWQEAYKCEVHPLIVPFDPAVDLKAEAK